MLLYVEDKLVVDKNGVAVNFSSLVKHNNDLITYVNGGHYETIYEVTNWDNFKVKGGEIIEDIDNQAVLLSSIVRMKLDNAEHKVDKKTILREIMEIKLKLLRSGL